MHRSRVLSGVFFAALFAVVLLSSMLVAATTAQAERAPPDRVSSGTIAFEQSVVTAEPTADKPAQVTLNGTVTITMTPQIRSVTVTLAADGGGLTVTLSPDTLTFTGSGDQPFIVSAQVSANGSGGASYTVSVSGRYASSPGALAYIMPPASAMVEVRSAQNDTNATAKVKKSTSSGGVLSILGGMCCFIAILPIVVVLLVVLLILWLIRRRRRAAGVATTAVTGAAAAALGEKKGFLGGLRDKIKDGRAGLPKPGSGLGVHRPGASVSRPSASIGAHRPAASVSRPSVGGSKGGALGKRGR